MKKTFKICFIVMILLYLCTNGLFDYVLYTISFIVITVAVIVSAIISYFLKIHKYLN